MGIKNLNIQFHVKTRKKTIESDALLLLINLCLSASYGRVRVKSALVKSLCSVKDIGSSVTCSHRKSFLHAFPTMGFSKVVHMAEYSTVIGILDRSFLPL